MMLYCDECGHHVRPVKLWLEDRRDSLRYWWRELRYRLGLKKRPEPMTDEDWAKFQDEYQKVLKAHVEAVAQSIDSRVKQIIQEETMPEAFKPIDPSAIRLGDRRYMTGERP